MWGKSRTVPGRGFKQVVQIVLCNFINLSLTRKEGICIFLLWARKGVDRRHYNFKFKVTSALKLPLLLRIQRTDPPAWVSYFPQGSYSFFPTQLLILTPNCTALSVYLWFLICFSHSNKLRLVALNPSKALEKRGFGTHTVPMLSLPLK